MFKNTHHTIQLMPRLADRSVVIKPVDPIYIPAGQRGTLYISTLLWISGFIEGQRDPLFDIPVILPKETWFGSNHRTGEIAYATAVDGRTELHQLKPRAFRAVTPIEFHNTSHLQLRFDRMNVPVSALPLFYSESTDRLWTSQIKVLHEGAILDHWSLELHRRVFSCWLGKSLLIFDLEGFSPCQPIPSD